MKPPEKKKLESEKKFIIGELDGFKDFVLDTMEQGIHDEYEDHFEFLKDCLATYTDMKNDEG